MKNNATDFELLLLLYLDGQCVKRKHLRAGKGGEIVGMRTGEVTLRPFKFQEAVLVGMATSLARVSILTCVEDPDLEDAPVVPDMGTIELRAFRCQTVGYRPAKHSYSVNLHLGHVSERSKKAGWHHVRCLFRALHPSLPFTNHRFERHSLIYLVPQTRYPLTNPQNSAGRRAT